MLTFTIIILICILALGVSLLASHWNSGAKSGEAVKIETLYKKNWRSFFWISLRVVSFALVTAFLFLMLLASFAGDDAAECCFLLMIFVIGSWFISIPILVIYISQQCKPFGIVIIRIKSFLAFIVSMSFSYFVLYFLEAYLFLLKPDRQFFKSIFLSLLSFFVKR